MSSRNEYPKSYFPFSDELCKFMDEHPEFLKALKLSNPKRFKFLPRIITSHTPHFHAKCRDEVIGMWYLDTYGYRGKTTPLFKQDFIVNIRTKHKEYHAYVDSKTFNEHASKKGKNFVHVINDFFRDYGEDGVYYHFEERGFSKKRWMHSYNNVEDLPDNEFQLLGTLLKIKHNSFE